MILARQRVVSRQVSREPGPASEFRVSEVGGAAFVAGGDDQPGRISGKCLPESRAIAVALPRVGGLRVEVAVVEEAGSLRKLGVEEGGNAAAGLVEALHLPVARAERLEVRGQGVFKRVLRPGKAGGLEQGPGGDHEGREGQAQRGNDFLHPGPRVGEGNGREQQQENLGRVAVVGIAAALDPKGDDSAEEACEEEPLRTIAPTPLFEKQVSPGGENGKQDGGDGLRGQLTRGEPEEGGVVRG